MSKYGFIREHQKGVTLSVKVKPRSSKVGPDIKELGANELVWRLSAAPVDGQANEELRTAVAKYFSLPQSRVDILVGQKSKVKVLLLQGVLLVNCINQLDANLAEHGK